LKNQLFSAGFLCVTLTKSTTARLGESETLIDFLTCGGLSRNDRAFWARKATFSLWRGIGPSPCKTAIFEETVSAQFHCLPGNENSPGLRTMSNACRQWQDEVVVCLSISLCSIG
jgi:hypothetical protein